MTNESTDSQPASGAPDPLRSLDGVDPPDQWNAIVDRASSPDHLPRSPVERRGVPRPLLAAAAFLLVTGVAGGLVMANRNQDDGALVTAGPGALPPDRSDAALAKAFWGYRFEVTAMVEGGRDRGMLPDPSGLAVVVDARVKGELVVSGCNAQSGRSRVEGGRLVADPDSWAGDHEICLTSQRLLAQDRWFEEFFQGGPSLDVDGEQVALRLDEKVIRLTREPVADPEASSTTVPPVHFPGKCAVGFDLGNGLDDGLLQPGPAVPSLGAKTGKVWHLSTETQSLEIQVPSIGVNGYGNRSVNVGAQRQGWMYSTGPGPVWLQVSPGATSPCESFDVIVTGPDPAANEKLALDIGEAIVLTSPVDPLGSGSASVIQRRWLLDIVLVDGVHVPVEDVANGGPDNRGGPPMIDATDPRSVTLRSCQIVELSLDESGPEPRLSLGGPGEASYAGCPGAAGRQHGQILKALSVGDPVSLGGDGHGGGRSLELRTQNVVFVFREV